MEWNKKKTNDYGTKKIKTSFVQWKTWVYFFRKIRRSVCCSFVGDLWKPVKCLSVARERFFDWIVPMVEIELSHTHI